MRTQHFTRLRWLVIAGATVLLSGCLPEGFPKCPPPGGIVSTTCYYKLKIIEKETPEAGLVIGKISDDVIQKNAERRKHWFSSGLLRELVQNDYDPKDYPSFQYAIHVKDTSTIEKGNDYYFVNEPNSYYLKLCDAKCLEDGRKKSNVGS
ncbi:MAG: hypothetical protein AB1555_02675 [Nitrospirota bacterium]